MDKGSSAQPYLRLPYQPCKGAACTKKIRRSAIDVIDNADENILDKEYRQLLQQAIEQLAPQQKKFTCLAASRGLNNNR
jgi:hypothetical protein